MSLAFLDYVVQRNEMGRNYESGEDQANVNHPEATSTSLGSEAYYRDPH